MSNVEVERRESFIRNGYSKFRLSSDLNTFEFQLRRVFPYSVTPRIIKRRKYSHLAFEVSKFNVTNLPLEF